jgi:hypothetical protein
MKCEKCGAMLGKNSGTINQFIKRFTKKCEWCNKKYDGVKVSKFCSNACRQRNKYQKIKK